MSGALRLPVVLALSAAAFAAQTGLVPVDPASAPKSTTRSTLADVGPARATLVPAPAEALIGEPIEWLLDVVHPKSMRVVFPAKAGEDRDWVPLGERVVVRAADPIDPELVHTIARWSAFPLTAGELAPAPLELDVTGGAATQHLVVTGLAVHVLPALAESEDAPRPLLGFRELAADLEPARGVPWGLVLGASTVVVALGVVWFARRRRKPAPVALPTPLARLADLDRRAAVEPESARAVVFELSRLVRGAVDAFLAADRSAFTDEGWTAAMNDDERVPIGVRRTCARLLASSERIKYAQETPTRFAVEELLKDARAALEALAAAPRVTEMVSAA